MAHGKNKKKKRQSQIQGQPITGIEGNGERQKDGSESQHGDEIEPPSSLGDSTAIANNPTESPYQTTFPIHSVNLKRGAAVSDPEEIMRAIQDNQEEENTISEDQSANRGDEAIDENEPCKRIKEPLITTTTEPASKESQAANVGIVEAPHRETTISSIVGMPQSVETGKSKSCPCSIQ